MKGINENKIIAFIKCIKTIDSCKTDFQLNSVDKMINNFYDLFKDENLYYLLISRSCKKWNNLLTTFI